MTTLAYPLPDGIPRHPDLGIAVDGRPAAVGDTPVAAYVVCVIDGPAAIEITANRPLAGTVIRPAARGIVASIAGDRLSFAIDRPGPLSIEIPGGKPLHLFVQPAAEPPPRDDPTVRHLEAGRIHELGEVRLHDGETLHIAGGAVLRGWVHADGARVRITGHGIIDGSRFPHHWRRSVLLDRCTDAVVEGISIIGSPSWTVVLAGCDRATVRRINLIGWVVCSDGIDVVGSRDVVVEDCFLRDNDDCVAMKAIDLAGIGAAAMRDVERVLVQRCVCWNDHAGNVFEIGYETRCARISGITFRDCDVLGAHGEGGVFTIHAGDRAAISDVLYEDIRVEHMYDKFVDFRVLHSRYSKDAERGRIHDITLRRIRTRPDPFNTVSLIGGFDAAHPVEGIRFADVRIGDLVLAEPGDLHLFIRHARDIAMSTAIPAEGQESPANDSHGMTPHPAPAHRMTPAMPKIRLAFSLIELLVVISIIAVLAAMLLPAIGLVKASAQTANCTNNLRQFGSAFLTYPTENDDRWPIGEWNPLIQPYIDDGNLASCLRIARCPGTPQMTTGGAPIGSTYAYPGVYWASWSVGPIFNDPQQFLFAWPFWLWSPYENKITAGKTCRITEKCLLSEYWDNSTATVANVAWGVNLLNDQRTSLAHRTSSNFLFADGHVQALPVTGVKLYNNIQWTSDPMWRPYNATMSPHSGK